MGKYLNKMNNINHKLYKAKLYYTFLAVFIAIDFFILPGQFRSIAEYLFALILFSFFISSKGFRKLSFHKTSHLIYALLMVLGLILQILLGENGAFYAGLTTCLVIGAYVVFFLNYESISLKKFFNNSFINIIENLVYIVMLVSLIIQMYIRLTTDPTIVYSSYNIFFSLGRDKNYLGVVVFGFFVFSYLRKRYLGILLSLFYAYNLNSRMIVFMIIIFIICKVFNNGLYRIWEKIFKRHTWMLFVFMFIFTILISYVFVYYASINGIHDYQSSLADGSNYMRCVGNIYSLELAIKNKEFIFFGVDNNIIEFLGADNYQNYFMGTRIVQPHNDIINLLIRNGLIYGVGYWGLLSVILSKIVNKKNISILIPFVFCSLFMHSIFIGAEIIFILFLIAFSDLPYKRLVKIKIGGKIRNEVGKRQFANNL